MRHEYKETHTSHFLVPVFVLSCPVMSLSLEKDTQFHLDLTMTNSTVHDVRSSSKICLFVQPWRVSSDGIWGKFSRPQWWLNNSLPLLELQLFLFFLLMSIIHLLLKPFGVSKISSQIITGLVFGCSWGQLNNKKLEFFRINSEEIIGLLACFGYMLFLFITAVKMDVRRTMKTGRKAWIIGIPSVFVPVICGLFVGSYFQDGLSSAEKNTVPLMVSIHSFISFPVIASLLSELKLVSTELGRLGMSSALIADLFSQFVMGTANQIRISRTSITLGYFSKAGIMVQICLILFVLRPSVLWLLKQTPEGKPVSRGTTHGIFLFVLISAVASALLGQPAIFGPYLLGLAIPDGATQLGFSLVEKLECFVSDFFLPLFVITCSLQVDISKIFIVLGAADARVNIVLSLVTYGVKLVCCFLCSLCCKLPLRDSFVLSLILSCKGVFELAFCSIITQYEVINRGILAWFIVFLLIVATFVPLTVKWLTDPKRTHDGYQNRNIMHLSPNSELRVLPCIHKNEHIYGLIHLLNLSCPTPQNPLAVYALHLIELVGRTTPIFISHRQENNAISDQTYSENVTLSFDHFEKDNSAGSVYAECFTVITPHKFMTNDICKLALDKVTSLIILPFHRTWTADGLIDQEDNMLRNLNCSVLQKADCSVAIFADKGHLGSVASMASSGTQFRYSVCLIYLGGSDDREAISFAKRMAKEPTIELTVLKLGSPMEDGSSSKWENMLDSEVLKDFKMNCLGNGGVRYFEEVCDDGPQTALTLRKIVNEFDLMIVGRRDGLESPQTAGLSEWNEFPELGVLGDLIASLDNNTRTSVLVIQQQK